MAFEEPILGSSGASGGGYVISNSMRFNSADSATLDWTPSGAGDSTTDFTVSMWVKRSKISSGTQTLFDADGTYEHFRFISDDTIQSNINAGEKFITTPKFRDPSAWYHIVWRADCNNGTATDKLRLYINGVENTAFSVDVTSQTAFTRLNTAVDHHIGSQAGTTAFFDGYIAECIGIDGTSLGPDSFGETDTNGNWVPIDPSGLTFGTNGWWQDYAVAPGTGNGAGTDVSGNGNHFTDSGLAANDQVTDSPTDDALNDVGNYCLPNPLDSGALTIANGNTKLTSTSGSQAIRSTFPIPAGSTDGWYWELDDEGDGANVGNHSGILAGGFGLSMASNLPDGGFDCHGWYDGASPTKFTGASTTAHGTAVTANERYHFAYKNGNLWIGKSNAWFSGDPSADTSPSITGIDTTKDWFPAFSPYLNRVANVYMRPSEWSYAAPTGFKALNTANLPAPTITDPSKYFQVDTFTGTGAELARVLTDASGAAVKPDLVWIKDRDTAVQHVLTDSVRGATKELNSDSTAAETTVAQGLKSFDASGYTLGTDGNYNASSSLNVAWCWNTQGGAGSSNTDGTINTTSTSVGATQGFSISTYTGTGSAATVGHGLGAAPEFIITTASNAVEGWGVYHHQGADETDNTILNTTAAATDNVAFWNDTAPTTSVFSVGTDPQVNKSGSVMLAYCWAGVDGFSKFGSYEGNANASGDGTFVYTGFRSRWIMVKNIDAAANWTIWDTARGTYNVINVLEIRANGALAEGVSADTTRDIDVLSNGFKFRGNAETDVNAANTYIYAAFAEYPFGGDGVSQARAR